MDLFFGKLYGLKVALALIVCASCQQENGSDEQSNNGVTVKPGEKIEKSTVYIASWYKDESENVNCSGVALTLVSEVFISPLLLDFFKFSRSIFSNARPTPRFILG